MTYSEACRAYYIEFAGTVASLDDPLSMKWTWAEPPVLPTMYVTQPKRQVVAPNVKTWYCKRFQGRRFKLGGSKT